jgi:hypothetical protein
VPPWALVLVIVLVAVIVASTLTDSVVVIILLGRVHRLQAVVCHAPALAARCP